jgi:sugar phosphate permease
MLEQTVAAPMTEAVAGPGDVERSAMRRIAWRLLPFLMLCYFVAYLDRVNVGFAALQMNADLQLSAAQYGFGAGLFFVSYCLLEVPSNVLLYRFGAPQWIARIMFTWGICAAAIAFVKTDTAFYVMRLLLGAAEAGFYPGVVFFLTLWFPAAYRARVLGLFLAAIPISGIIGAPSSGLLLSLDGLLGLRGWQWLFLVEAAPAIFLAPVVVRFLQNGPADATWLPADEREWLVGQLAREQRQVEGGRTYTLRQALTRPLVLLLAVGYFANVCLLNGIQFFLPQIVKGLGMSNIQTGFVTAIPSLVALVALLWWGQRSDRTGERFGHAATANAVGGAALLLAMLVQNPVVRVGALALAFGCTLAFTAPFWTIPGSFLSRGAAAAGIAAISSIGVTGGFLAPWFVGVTRDLTGDFRIGLGAIAVMTLALTMGFLVFGRRWFAAERAGRAT